MPERQLRGKLHPYYWLIPTGFGAGLALGGNLSNHVWPDDDQAGGVAIVVGSFGGLLLGALAMFLGAPVREFWRRFRAGELQSQIDARNAHTPEQLRQQREAARAAQAARAQAEAKARAEAADRRVSPEKRHVWYREREAEYAVGSDEWNDLRSKHHLNEVALVTGVRWRTALWADARSSAELNARSMMKEFRAEDRRLIAAAALEARNKALTAAERRGGVAGWDSAERFAAQWMRTMYSNVKLTNAGADQGVDVRADGVVAQVKFAASKTGRPALQKLLGAADGARPLFFVHDIAGYSAPAVEWADDNEMALFTYDWSGNVEPANEVAEDLIAEHEAKTAERQARRELGRLDLGKAIEVARRWLDEQLPGLSIRTESESDDDPMHLTTDRLAVAVCLSPTNEVGRPRIERLVATAGDRSPVVFVSTPKGLSSPAMAWADEHSVGVFGYSYSGRVDPLNQRAQTIEAAFQMQAQS